jgi:hypothetical protein
MVLIGSLSRKTMPTESFVCTLGEVICGRRIVIPPIQRDYAWNIGNTATNPAGSQSTRLYDDFVAFSSQLQNGHTQQYFLGNLIAVVDPEKDWRSPETEWQLLDGQQRMTSFALMMKAFDYKLDLINSALARELQQRIQHSCLVLSDIEDVQHPYPIKHRRPRDRNTFHRFMSGRHDELVSESNMERVALEYYNCASRYETVGQIESFLDAVLDNILVSVTLTDDISMGFQMFLTTNATGLSLTAYDMFRAFVVKKIETDFIEIPGGDKRNLHRQLDELEQIFQSASWGDDDKKREKNLKDFLSNYMSMRNGRHLDARTIVSHIEKEINLITTPFELLEYLFDMKDYATFWYRNVHPGRPQYTGTYRFRFIRRMHRFGMKIANGPFLSFSHNTPHDRSIWLLSVVEWSLIKQLLLEGQFAGNTNVFYGFTEMMNQVWTTEYTHQDLFDFRRLWLEETIQGDELNAASQTFDTAHNCFYALLHRLEREGEGLASADPGRNSRTTTIIPFVSQEMAGEAYFHIGNFYLTPGSGNNGLSHQQKTAHEASDEFDERQETVLTHMSDVEHNMRQEIQNMHEGSNFEQFIMRRTIFINRQLNEKYLQFMEQDPPAFD